MAITSARMQIKRGNESEFDPEKMLPGEWALSIDKKIVRICVAPNVCIRMATYDAFEVDMAKIEKILEECQTIEDAVKLINSQVSEKLQATIEYTNQAKQYRDEAKQFRNEAETFTPDGYTELQETVASNTAKIDTIIEKAELNIKNTASGENIHLTDSANGKNVEFGLYGKSEQKQYSGKNLVDGIDLQCLASDTAEKSITNAVHLTVGTYTLSWVQSATLTGNVTRNTPTIRILNNESSKNYQDTTPKRNLNAGRYYWTFSIKEENDYIFGYWMHSPGVDVTISNIQLESGSVMTDFEPYTNGPSPNPDYTQEITVSGSDGSVEALSCGKNLAKDTRSDKSNYTDNGITFATNKDGSITATGRIADSSVRAVLRIIDAGVWVYLPKGEYIISSGLKERLGYFQVSLADVPSGTVSINKYAYENPVTLNLEKPMYAWLGVAILKENTLDNNVTFYPMIRLASDTDDTYEPYKESTITIPTPDGLAGIKVSSGGNYTEENGQQWITDEIVKYADGSGKRVQRIGKAVFDGSDDEVWRNRINDYTNKADGQTRFSSELSMQYDTDRSIGAISNLGYIGKIDSVINYTEVGVSFYTSSTQTTSNVFYVTLKNANVTDLNTFRTWLASNNAILYYPLAEPIITDLTAEEIAEIEKLHTFYPVTNISNDADCGMSVTYLCDAKNYIDNRLALIETALINSI